MFEKNHNPYAKSVYTNNAIVRDEFDPDGEALERYVTRDIKIGEMDVSNNTFSGVNSTIDWHIKASYDPTHSYLKEYGDYVYDPALGYEVSTPDVYSKGPREIITIKKIISKENRITTPDVNIWENDPIIETYCSLACEESHPYKPSTLSSRNDLYQIPEIGKSLKLYLPDNWWVNHGDFAQTLSNNTTTNQAGEVNNPLMLPSQFKKKSADKITNFNPSTDALEVDTDTFGIDNSATFAAGSSKKEVKKVLAKQDFDFLYDQKKGGLYFNENGSDKGFGDGGIIAILKGAPDLTASNLEFI